MTGHSVAGLMAALAGMLAVFVQVDEPSGARASQEIPEAKRTSLQLYVTATEAFDWWRARPDQLKILDVRTPEEYIFVGHAPMAWNIPVAFQTYEWDDDTRSFAMQPNETFVSQVMAWADRTETILVMCRSGGRSAKAVNVLAESGFTNLYNIVDGMEGDKVDDPRSVFHGKRMKNGWKNSGLPWTYELDPERMRLPER